MSPVGLLLVFDAYTAFEESILTAKMEQLEQVAEAKVAPALMLLAKGGRRRMRWRMTRSCGWRGWRALWIAARCC